MLLLTAGLVAVSLDVGGLFFKSGFQGVFFTVAVRAIGWLVNVRAKGIAEVKSLRIGPEGGVDHLNVGFADSFWVVTVVFVKALLEGIIHGVDGGLAVFIAFQGVEIRLLDEEKDEKE